MTRFVYDQFAKEYLKELLSSLGRVETAVNIAVEVREIDVLFYPEPARNAEGLGLLGRLAIAPAIFEPYRNAITPAQIRICLGKLFDLMAYLERNAKREKTRQTEAGLPNLWILTPTISPKILQGFGAIEDPENWLKGIYFLPASLKTAIIVIHQLPPISETLWLRMLGKGNVQKQAILELKTLPEDNLYRESALELLYDLLTILQVRENLGQIEREVIMELAGQFRKRLQAATQEGMQQGIQQGMQQGIQQAARERIESLLELKFGEIDAELSQIIEPLIRGGDKTV